MIFRTFHIDRRNLVLPDGRVAEDLRLLSLQAELMRLGIPGITHEDGKDALLSKYGAHVAEIAEKLPQSRGIHRHALSQSAGRRAAEVIARQVAGAEASPPPIPPIASTRA